MTNPTPQPHADDIKLAELIATLYCEFVHAVIKDLTVESASEMTAELNRLITSVTQPLRLSNEELTKMLDEATKDSNDFANKLVVVQDENEALRERVKELESALHRINDTICIHHNDAERATLKGDCRICQNNKLTAASEVIEKCDRALNKLTANSFDSMDRARTKMFQEQALAAIKEWKGKQ